MTLVNELVVVGIMVLGVALGLLGIAALILTLGFSHNNKEKEIKDNDETGSLLH